jgi:hypothetical protein
MRKHLRASDLHPWETNHSFRRGALQAAAELGLGEATLKELGQIKSSSVLSRGTDTSRHLMARPARRRRV